VDGVLAETDLEYVGHEEGEEEGAGDEAEGEHVEGLLEPRGVRIRKFQALPSSSPHLIEELIESGDHLIHCIYGLQHPRFLASARPSLVLTEIVVTPSTLFLLHHPSMADVQIIDSGLEMALSTRRLSLQVCAVDWGLGMATAMFLDRTLLPDRVFTDLPNK